MTTSSPDPHRRRYPPWLRRVMRAGRWRSAIARRRGARWRLLSPMGFVATGVLLATSGINAQGTDLRPQRYDDLAGLAREETGRVQRLQDQVAALQTEVDDLSGQVDSRALQELQTELDALAGPAGLTAVEGPGLSITLQDAPASVRESAGDQVANAIVHQQDIQAVVNALWNGGAEAMTIQRQRVVSTTGIKCVGNTVLLHGVTYSPPYVIAAIGDVDRLRASVDSSPYIRAYLQAVDEWQLGWNLQVEDSVRAPAFDGLLELQYAKEPSDLR